MPEQRLNREEVGAIFIKVGAESVAQGMADLKYSGDYFDDTLTKFAAFSGDLFPEVNFDEQEDCFHDFTGRLF